jgi:hypothetical protein
MSWQSWLMMAFALGASLSISWIAIGIYQLRRIVRRSEIASDEGRREFRRLARDMGIRRPVRLLLSPDPITPMASGLFRATVIVPKSMMQQLSFPDRQAILGHELATIGVSIPRCYGFKASSSRCGGFTRWLGCCTGRSFACEKNVVTIWLSLKTS